MLHGWLFDVYPSEDGMVLWIIDSQGKPHRVRYPYAPSMYIGGDRRAREAAETAVRSFGIQITTSPAVQKELMSGDEIDVLRVAVDNPLAYSAVARRLAKVPGLTLYNCDVPLGRLFFYESRLFPLARVGVSCDADIAREIGLESQSDDLEYELPPLMVLRLRLRHELGNRGANPTHGPRGRIEAIIDGDSVVLEGEDPRESIHSLNRLLAQYDPDIILTEWGDEVLLPGLRAMARDAGVPLALNRDAAAGVRLRRSRSYMTYGKVVFQGGAQMLHGRWHLDLRNSFIYGESELAGLLDVARLSRIPVQELARTSTGTAISSMQLNQAILDGVLIPWQKSEPEGFKTANQLLLSDKGGLTYQPIVGMFEEVGELDFSSMYPTMMAHYNISPETIGCTCCPDSLVPEIGYTVCRKRRGLVPSVLDHLLERRMYYKRRKQETEGVERSIYDQRQTALKWCLVTCLDGDTLILHRRGNRWTIGSIRSIVDTHLLESEWGSRPVEDLEVWGIGADLGHCVRRVAKVLKAPAPRCMVRVRLQWGREFLITPNHRCYVLQDGRLQVKLAHALERGDWIPIATALPPQDQREEVCDFLGPLKRQLSVEHQKKWRVFGQPVQRLVREQYIRFQQRAREEYTAKTIWNWREYGYVPLLYVRLEDFWAEEHSQLFIGRGKRTGGLIQQIPASCKVDEDLGFLLGFFVGDGSATGNMLRFAVGANEQEHLERLQGIILRKFRLRSRWYRERKAQMYVLQVNSVALIELFRIVFKIEGSADRGKLHVPEFILNGPRELQRGFILGLLASDGHVSRVRNFICISSASRQFILEIGLLFLGLGIEYRLANQGRLHHIQTKNLEETLKVLHDGAPMSHKHARNLQGRQAATSHSRPTQVPVRASGLLELCKTARVARSPRISGVGVISRAMAQVKLTQILQRIHRLDGEALHGVSNAEQIIDSGLSFARVVSVEEVPYDKKFVYCFELAEEPEAFVIEGGVLTGNSFGYLGYRNARFGRIEAHESTTAYAREKLLQAKEIAEARGFRMLHALVDSMWLQRSGATRDDYETLAQEVTEKTELPIFVEGMYRWIGFLPSKTHRGVGVPNRYMGVFGDNTTKVRGIEVRRSDVPILVEEMQEKMLQRMFRCKTLVELQSALPEVLAILEEALVRVRSGEVTASELVITNRLSQEVEKYRHNTVQAITARTLDRHGADLHPGEAVQFIITDRNAKVPEDRVRPYTLLGTDWSYDADAYAQMLVRAGETVLELLGYSEERLWREAWQPVRANPASARSPARSGPTALGSGY